MSKPTGKNVAAFLARFTPGTPIRFEVNEYIPSRDGLEGVILKGGRTSLSLTTTNARGNIDAGGVYWFPPPQNVSGFVDVGEDCITYLIRGEHRSTVRILEGVR